MCERKREKRERENEAATAPTINFCATLRRVGWLGGTRAVATAAASSRTGSRVSSGAAAVSPSSAGGKNGSVCPPGALAEASALAAWAATKAPTRVDAASDQAATSARVAGFSGRGSASRGATLRTVCGLR